MSVPTGAPGDEVPEADWAEQAAEAGPGAEGEGPASAAPAVSRAREADEADLVEQGLSVEYDDDEH
jgi:hypothetical protein